MDAEQAARDEAAKQAAKEEAARREAEKRDATGLIGQRDGFVFLKYIGRAKYLGMEIPNKALGVEPGTDVIAMPGEVIEVSARKAKQLSDDFPREWAASSLEEWRKHERDRKKQVEQAEARADLEMKASIEREKKARLRRTRSSQSATDDEDD